MKKFLKYNLLPVLVNILILTLRVRINNKEALNKKAVFVFWHSQMLLGWYLFKHKSPAALVSKSKDGEVLTNILNKWNYTVFRGSSSNSGKEALNSLISHSDKFGAIAITPDGPRGPKEEFKNGALAIALKTGLSIIPVSIILQKKKILEKSWDKFEIPFPFSYCEITFGKEFIYDKILEGTELANLKTAISAYM